MPGVINPLTHPHLTSNEHNYPHCTRVYIVKNFYMVFPNDEGSHTSYVYGVQILYKISFLHFTIPRRLFFPFSFFLIVLFFSNYLFLLLLLFFFIFISYLFFITRVFLFFLSQKGRTSRWKKGDTFDRTKEIGHSFISLFERSTFFFRF